MNDVKNFWKPLEKKISALVQRETKNCVRSKKMTVTVAPDGTTVGVAEAFGDTIQIPYSSALAAVTVGAGVWCVWMEGDASTLVAMWPGTLV